MTTQSDWLRVEEMVENPVVPSSAIDSSSLLHVSALCAAGDSNPAPRIKNHVYPVLVRIASCSFVLVTPIPALDLPTAAAGDPRLEPGARTIRAQCAPWS